jgi:hypothetical protein
MPNRFVQPDNPFLKARLRAAEKEPRFSSRVFAARQIHCSDRSLEGYEAGYHVPPDSVVLKMAEVYDDVFLVFEALEQTEYGQFLKNFLGLSVNRSAVPEAILQYINERNDLSDELMSKLIAAGADAQFDAHEQPVVRTVAQESRDFISRAAVLVCLGTRFAKEKTVAGTTA